jgi:hypothetical protein
VQLDCKDCYDCDGKQCKPRNKDSDCCDSKVPGAGGFVVCCNGQQVACVASNLQNASPLPANLISKDCIIVHEQTHFGQTHCPDGDAKCNSNPLSVPSSESGHDECLAYQAEVACLRAELQDPSHNCRAADCISMVNGNIQSRINTGNIKEAGCFPN